MIAEWGFRRFSNILTGHLGFSRVSPLFHTLWGEGVVVAQRVSPLGVPEAKLQRLAQPVPVSLTDRHSAF